MPRLIWTAPAAADLDRCYRLLAKDNVDAARRAIAAVRSGANILTDHPQIGRPALDWPGGYREWPIRYGAAGYVMLYRPFEDDVVILALRHMREAGFRRND